MNTPENDTHAFAVRGRDAAYVTIGEREKVPRVIAVADPPGDEKESGLRKKNHGQVDDR